MTTADISNVKKLIKEIKNKLNELERAIDKTPQKKFGYPTNTQSPSPRKRNVYRDSDNNTGNN
ncbi:MAG: hypothetical protein ABIY50_05935 [Ignavibacteria bacterium]